MGKRPRMGNGSSAVPRKKIMKAIHITPAFCRQFGIKLIKSNVSRRTKTEVHLYDCGEDWETKKIYSRWVVVCPIHDIQFWIENHKQANGLLSYPDSFCKHCRATVFE